MCLDILNFQVDCLSAETDEHVLLHTWTSNVGYSPLGIRDPGPVDSILLHRPSVLCSAGRRARRTFWVWHASRLWRTLRNLRTVRPLPM